MKEHITASVKMSLELQEEIFKSLKGIQTDRHLLNHQGNLNLNTLETGHLNCLGLKTFVPKETHVQTVQAWDH